MKSRQLLQAPVEDDLIDLHVVEIAEEPVLLVAVVIVSHLISNTFWTWEMILFLRRHRRRRRLP